MLISIFLAVAAAVAPGHRQAPVDSIMVPTESATSFALPDGSDFLGPEKIILAQIWLNQSDVAVRPIVRFTAFSDDGREMGSCDSHPAHVDPGARVQLYCAIGDFDHVPRHRVVIARLITINTATGVPLEGVEVTNVQVKRTSVDFREAQYAVQANVRATSADVGGFVGFRLYRKDGVQLSECVSESARFRPEIGRRVSNAYCAAIPRRLGSADSVIAVAYRN